jgi:hypothetical protein
MKFNRWTLVLAAVGPTVFHAPSIQGVEEQLYAAQSVAALSKSANTTD